VDAAVKPREVFDASANKQDQRQAASTQKGTVALAGTP
jgi:hypothetical protein